MTDIEKEKNLFGAFGNIENEKFTSLKGKYHTTWTEDSFFFEKKMGNQIASLQSKEYLSSSFTEKKFFYFIIFILIFFLIFIGRLSYLQIIKGEEYRSMAAGNSQRIIPIPAERGLIYDRNDIQLTKNIPSFSIALMPQYLPRDKEERREIIKRLSEITNQKEKHVTEIFDQYGSYSYESIIIQEDIDYETALRILIDASDLPGIHIQRGSKRLYIHNFGTEENTYSLSHIIGYQSKLGPEELEELYDEGYLPSDYIGKTGVEKIYERYLHGTYGKKRIEVDALGKEQITLAQEPPSPGSYIKLSIDIKMQEALESIIEKTLIINNNSRGAAVVMNPNNGEILALVSLPSYDNNDFSGGINQKKYNEYLNNENNPLFSRAISGTYPSGSTAKPAVAASALQEGIVSEWTSFLSNGGLEVGSWFFPDWRPGGHGQTNVRKSIAWSVNTFYYYIGGGYENFTGLGVKKITEYLRKFGFAKKTGIDLPGEASGFLPSKEWKEEVKEERWYVGDTYNLSIGQGDLLATPLQIANMTSAVANGGTLFKPHVVKSIVDPLTKEEKYTEKEIIEQNFIDPANMRVIRLGMKDCVEYGTCQWLSSLPFSTAGKTGTAQWSSVKNTHAWFTSFAPFENPKIVITVVVEEGGEGGLVALPIAQEFYRWWWGNHDS